LKKPSRKVLDQIGIILLIAGVVIAMGVSAMASRGLKIWISIVCLVIGLLLVVVGLWLARTFRKADPDRPHRQDGE
jgi:uncharacterized membrane protein